MSVVAAPPSAPAGTLDRSPRRSDIQGLRATASLLVAVFHIWFGSVSGGVDVFFVIGGYLLAGSLIGELERTGRVRPVRYLRRLTSRQFPMAGLVLLVVAITLVLAGPPLALDRHAWDVLAAATYWENWRLAADATDYIAAGHAKSAVQHFWAMSAQLQMTLVLVALLAGAGAVAHRLGLTVRVAVIPVLLLTILWSFGYALVGLAESAEATYFDTWARLWEFAIGALAALVASRVVARMPSRMLRILPAVGLVLVLTAGLLPQTWSYPGPVAVWPVLGALLILVPGSRDPGAGGTFLTWRPLVWLGGLSYGLYLWSWPILKSYLSLFPARAVGGIPLMDGLVLLALSVAASWIAARGLAGLAYAARRGTAPDEPGRRAAQVGRMPPRVPVTALILPLVVVLAGAGVAVGPTVQRNALAALSAGEPAPDAATVAAAVRSALVDPFVPGGDHVTGGEAFDRDLTLACFDMRPDLVDTCRFGPADAGEEVWIVGDSQAAAWTPGLIGAVGRDRAVQLMGLSGCPFTTGEALNRLEDLRSVCDDHAAWVMEQARERRPSRVIVSYGSWWTDDDDAQELPIGTALGRGTAPLVEELLSLGTAVVWLDVVPPFDDLDACLSADSPETAELFCSSPVDPVRRASRDELAQEMQRAGAEVVTTLPWFCDEELLACPAFVAGVLVRADATHPSPQYGEFLTHVLEQSLFPTGR